jgi:hypothetical protein
MVAPAMLGGTMRPLLWVFKSMDNLAAAQTVKGPPISGDILTREPVELGYSRQHNRKTDERSRHPDRDAQFDYINAKVVAAQAAVQPVISLDTKKKELVGNHKNGGSDYRPKGTPFRVKVHVFMHKKLGEVAPKASMP